MRLGMDAMMCRDVPTGGDWGAGSLRELQEAVAKKAKKRCDDDG